jgi:hypothetical protein
VYGYRAVDAGDGSSRKRLEIEATEAAVVRRIFADFLAGQPQRLIAQRLNGEGIKSPRGGKWTHFTTRAMLRNERYAGVIVFGQREWKRVGNKRRYVDRPKSEQRRREVPSMRIIDAATWAASQQLVRTTEREHKQGVRRKGAYPLSGLLACGACGGSMVISGGGKYYQCSARQNGVGCDNRSALRERDARAWLLDRVSAEAGEPAMLEALLDGWRKDEGDAAGTERAELQRLRAALATAAAQVDRLLDYVAEGNDSPAVRAKLQSKQDAARQASEQIAALELRRSRVTTLPSVADMRAFLASLPDVLVAEPTEARAFLGELLDGPVRCSPAADGYALNFAYFPDALLNETSADPVRGRRSFEVVAGAGLHLKRASRAVAGVCPVGYAEAAQGLQE